MTRIANSKTQLHAEMSVIWYYLYIKKNDDSPMISTVGPEHFVASPLLGDWWRKARELCATNQPIDLMAISRPYHDAYVAISDFQEIGLSRSRIESVEKLMREGAALHHAMVGAKDWLEQAEHDDDATVEDLHSAFGELAARFQVGGDIEAERCGSMTKEAILDFYDPDIDRGVPVPVIGDKVRHYKFKKYYLIGGLTSNHKTTFALQSVLYAAKSGYPTLIWTLEDDNLEIIQRIMVAQCDYMTLDHFEVGSKPTDRSEIAGELMKLGTDNENLPIHHLDIRMTLTKTVAQIARMVYRHKIKVVVIDFLQLILRDDPRTPETQHVTECAQTLADLAKRLNIVIITVVQLSQEATKRATEGEAPRLGDIRGGSSIAQAAYGAIMCHRPAPDPKKSQLPEGQQRLQLWIRKWKRANLGGADCLVDAAHDRITLEPDMKPPPARKFYSTS